MYVGNLYKLYLAACIVCRQFRFLDFYMCSLVDRSCAEVNYKTSKKEIIHVTAKPDLQESDIP